MKVYYEVGLLFMTVLLSPLYGSPAGETRASSQHLEESLVSYKEKEFNHIFNRDDRGANHIHHRHYHSFWRLRNQVDKLILKQKIDQLLIQNLQKNVKNIEKLFQSKLFQKDEDELSKNMKNYSPTNSKVNEAKILEKDNFMNLKNSENFSQNIFADSFFKFDFDSLGNKILEKFDLQIKKVLTEEMKNIRSKMSETERCKKCDVAMQSKVKEKSTVQWMLQIVPILQKNVKDLQESTNVVQALHDKQDFDSRLTALGRDVTALQKGRSTLTSEIESVVAVTDTLTGEMKEATSRIQKVEGILIQVKEQLEEQKAASDDLLKALPDGFLAGGFLVDPRHNGQDDHQHSQQSRSVDATPIEDLIEGGRSRSVGIHGVLDSRIEKLELRTASLDFALMNLQKKVFFETVESMRQISSNISSKTTPVKQDGGARDLALSKRFDEIEFELSKLKDSSESVLKALSTVEKRSGDSLKEIDQKLSKVEVQIDREREERQSKNAETRSSFLETEKEVRDDYVELKNDVTFLKKQFITLKGRTKHFDKTFHINDDNNSSTATNQRLTFDNDKFLNLKISEVCLETIKTEHGQHEDKLLKLEKLYETIERAVKKNSKVFQKRLRHRHGKRKHS